VYQGASYLAELCNQIEMTKLLFSKSDINLCEAIFVCDEPKDQSVAVLRELSQSYSFVKIIELSANRGQHLATAAGILSAMGEWIATLDEDLQHRPALLPTLLKEATGRGLDVIYCKTTIPVHSASPYRDFFSRLAKASITFLTGYDFFIVSSFRIVRGSIARAAAVCMDQFQYLDSNIFFLTSPRRRSSLSSQLQDIRPSGTSGYTISKLLSHYSRLIFSSAISGRKSLLVILLPAMIILILAPSLFLSRALISGIYSVSPGWASVFLGIIILIGMASLSLALITKMTSILAVRTLAFPPYLVLDRATDADIHQALSNG
jgi:polyisoprenyl-phosphate glycosyltransferase